MGCWPCNRTNPKNGDQLCPHWGAIDPRIAYHPKTQRYYLAWDNCTNYCSFRQTQLSSTLDPYDHTAWVHHGALLKGASHQASTAGAGFLFRDGPSPTAGGSHLAFVATGTVHHPQWEQVLVIARSADAVAWDVETCNATAANRCCLDTSAAARQGSPSPCLDHDCCSPTAVCADPIAGNCQSSHAATAGVGRRVLIAPRLGCWDDGGICAGPQPELLSDGNYLFIYNHDSHDETGSPSGRCSFGWAILAGSDPTKVVARGSAPIVAGCDCSSDAKGQVGARFVACVVARARRPLQDCGHPPPPAAAVRMRVLRARARTCHLRPFARRASRLDLCSSRPLRHPTPCGAHPQGKSCDSCGTPFEVHGQTPEVAFADGRCAVLHPAAPLQSNGDLSNMCFSMLCRVNAKGWNRCRTGWGGGQWSVACV